MQSRIEYLISVSKLHIVLRINIESAAEQARLSYNYANGNTFDCSKPTNVNSNVSCVNVDLKNFLKIRLVPGMHGRDTFRN